SDEYLRLKSHLLGLAAHRSVEKLVEEFQRIPFEPYAPVRRQLLNMLRAVNRARGEAGFEPVPVSVLRLRRRIIRPFGDGSIDSTLWPYAEYGPRNRSPLK